MSDNEVYDRLREPFEEAAYSADTSRGFELTSIKAAYVFERLNEVFGLCGQGWRYAHSPFEEIDNEVTTEIALQWEHPDPDDGDGPIEWDNMVGHWRRVEGAGWSAPIFSPGGKQIIKGRRTDARKSAITDGITKAASIIGVGSDVFKGLVRVGKPAAQRPTQPSPQAESARERAKTGAKPPATNGKTVRPAKPEVVKGWLEKKSADGPAVTASQKQAEKVAQLAQEVWVDDKNAEQNYHSCIKYLFGVDSSKKLTKGQASAMISYLKESDESWDLHPDAIQEMKAILTAAIKDAGQQTLPLDAPFEGEWEDTTV